MASKKVGDHMAIYLDNAASAKVNPKVLAEFIEIAETHYGNPSSEHAEGYAAEGCIELSKMGIASIIHCDADDIFFTSGATMSNQLLIQGFVARHPNAMVVITNVEHNDIMMLMDNLSCYKHILKVDNNGIINIKELDKVLDYSNKVMKVPILVSIQMANSETGVMQPIQEIASVVHNYDNAFLHMDATQYIPHYPINMEYWGIDSISMSGQKIGGIKGSGLLVVRQILRNHVKPIIYGEQGLIGGTPSTPLIASLRTAFTETVKKYPVNSAIKDKRDALLSGIKELGGILVGGLENRLPNNIYCRFPGVEGLKLLYLLDEQDIYIGTGSACSTDSDKPSHVAKAYGLTDEEALECVRFTLSEEITYTDIGRVLNVLKNILTLI